MERLIKFVGRVGSIDFNHKSECAVSVSAMPSEPFLFTPLPSVHLAHPEARRDTGTEKFGFAIDAPDGMQGVDIYK